MLSGVMPRAEEIAGTAVLRIVVSSDSMKKATATSHGRIRRAVSDGLFEEGGLITGRMDSWEEISRNAFYSYASRSGEGLIARHGHSIQSRNSFAYNAQC